MRICHIQSARSDDRYLSLSRIGHISATESSHSNRIAADGRINERRGPAVRHRSSRGRRGTRFRADWGLTRSHRRAHATCGAASSAWRASLPRPGAPAGVYGGWPFRCSAHLAAATTAACGSGAGTPRRDKSTALLERGAPGARPSSARHSRVRRLGGSALPAGGTPLRRSRGGALSLPSQLAFPGQLALPG